MKRWFFVSVILFSFHLSQAQKLISGPRAGINLSGMNGVDGNLVRAGWAIGGFVMYQPTERVGLSCDLLLSARGTRSKKSIVSDSVLETWDSYINLNYLEVPLLFNIYISKRNKVFRPRIFAGPLIALKLSATESLKYNKVQDNGDTSLIAIYHVSPKYKSADIGAVFGAGFNYKMGEKVYFSLDARYYLGIVDVRNNNNLYSSALYNHNFSVLIGIGYQIGP